MVAEPCVGDASSIIMRYRKRFAKHRIGGRRRGIETCVLSKDEVRRICAAALDVLVRYAACGARGHGEERPWGGGCGIVWRPRGGARPGGDANRSRHRVDYHQGRRHRRPDGGGPLLALPSPWGAPGRERGRCARGRLPSGSPKRGRASRSPGRARAISPVPSAPRMCRKWWQTPSPSGRSIPRCAAPSSSVGRTPR